MQLCVFWRQYFRGKRNRQNLHVVFNLTDVKYYHFNMQWIKRIHQTFYRLHFPFYTHSNLNAEMLHASSWDTRLVDLGVGNCAF